VITFIDFLLLFKENNWGSRDSSTTIATGWTAGVPFPVMARDLSSLQSVQSGSGSHSAFNPMNTSVSFLGGKAAEETS
jgi:hypothetical protein